MTNWMLNFLYKDRLEVFSTVWHINCLFIWVVYSWTASCTWILKCRLNPVKFCPLLHSTEERWRLLETSDTHHGTPRLFGFFSTITRLEYRICWNTRKANRWESHREGICQLFIPCKPLARRKFHPRHSSYNFNFEPDLH